jgi:ariadne-1
MRSAGCAHFFCRECWRGYVGEAVEDGARCLSLQCPDTLCSAPVAWELVDEVAEPANRARYAKFALRSYVEENGGRIKWCPGAGCSHAVEFLGCADEAADVFCLCRHGFCFRCGEEAHRPVTCETVRRWLLEHVSDALTANWVLANAKHCPKCGKPIEKSTGCNHMTCRCGYHFCWICLGQAGAGYHYCCEEPKLDKSVVVVAETKEEQKKRQAKASLGRYMYHYERWAANLASLKMALADMDKLQRSGLEEMAAAVGCTVPDLDFLKEAYEQVADGRRVLRWSHAYGYFLDPERERDAKKRDLFGLLHNYANNALERLHGCAELESKELMCASSSSSGDKKEKFVAYKERLTNLTRVTRNYFENLVKAFETDLPEIFAFNF